MVSLSEALKTVPNKSCAWAEWLKTLSEEDRTAVVAAIADPDWPTHSLLAVLKEHGTPIGKEKLVEHRRGNCAKCQS